MTRKVLIALLAAAAVLTGCGDDGAEEEAEPTAAPTAADVVPTEPAEPEPTEAAAESETETYRVRSGDTLSAIAVRHGTTVRALVRLNDIDDPNEIRAGQRLQVPVGD